ncbi:uncharacterized protein EV422DRAFT_572061 [Fimicolochytrium jonesii]|uniref:uncharacterized protein n=1 Tax=Fimicolochytrium jonesii TaxID=1396493 RepID=UPI0022FE947B|nr:uncharacterized protein EV422DRAFT_572061 [Fimicolochytrium jonesii]KAI8816167.1 hypothetical protein EV422DRAFT_572061 [Fimicolochytrium jonesii]
MPSQQAIEFLLTEHLPYLGKSAPAIFPPYADVATLEGSRCHIEFLDGAAGFLLVTLTPASPTTTAPSTAKTAAADAIGTRFETLQALFSRISPAYCAAFSDDLARRLAGLDDPPASGE